MPSLSLFLTMYLYKCTRVSFHSHFKLHFFHYHLISILLLLSFYIFLTKAKLRGTRPILTTYSTNVTSCLCSLRYQFNLKCLSLLTGLKDPFFFFLNQQIYLSPLWRLHIVTLGVFLRSFEVAPCFQTCYSL
ncbi:hypothetical protein NL108_010009 [Boleophthalmus pectinirostris]|nr:hypothetical protein NL108_010009 [Boleophthalmus pectinirostris]